MTAESGSNRVNRGGSWNNNARNCRSANRNNNSPDNRNDNLGLRLVSTRSCRRMRFTDRIRVQQALSRLCIRRRRTSAKQPWPAAVGRLCRLEDRSGPSTVQREGRK
jgi:hypothetical protein